MVAAALVREMEKREREEPVTAVRSAEWEAVALGDGPDEGPAAPLRARFFWPNAELGGLNPPLSEAERAALEASLGEEGCLDPLVVWEERGLLLDGYNRLEICQRRGISFAVRKVSLPDWETARRWVLRHQECRRNLTPEGRSYLRGIASKWRKARPEAASRGQAKSLRGTL